ncbi:MAG: transposase [Bacteroidota bacterium]
MMTLDDIIDNKSSDPRELKRALIVKMDRSGVPRKQIASLFNVPETNVSRWCIRYDSNGQQASSLLLGYKGSTSYLNEDQKSEIVQYLKGKTSIRLNDLKKYILDKYGVKYKSDQSYYDLLKMENMSWKKHKKKPQKKRSRSKKG